MRGILSPFVSVSISCNFLFMMVVLHMRWREANVASLTSAPTSLSRLTDYQIPCFQSESAADLLVAEYPSPRQLSLDSQKPTSLSVRCSNRDGIDNISQQSKDTSQTRLHAPPLSTTSIL